MARHSLILYNITSIRFKKNTFSWNQITIETGKLASENAVLNVFPPLPCRLRPDDRKGKCLTAPSCHDEQGTGFSPTP